MGEASRRRNVWVADELWAAVVEAAALETVADGGRVTTSEWVRRALRERLERYGDAS